jgi:pimeloyl-ACP methyl ester carboxylesterase
MSAQILHAQTPLLDVAYETGGPENGAPVLLLHGWPDDVRTYDGVRPALHAAGFRTLVPWLRGFGPTRFLSTSTPRSGQISAMAQDILEFADALGITRFRIVGHDWGARIAYFLASVAPARVERMVTLSAGWDPGPWQTPALPHAKNFWYQWFMATERGADVVRRDPVAFARFQWTTWSPPEWRRSRPPRNRSTTRTGWPLRFIRIVCDGMRPSRTRDTPTSNAGSKRCGRLLSRRC